MYKLLVFDVDDTLLNSNKELPDSALRDILTLKKKYLVTIASGRAAKDIQEISTIVPCDIPLICSSGACIVDNKSNAVLVNYPVSAQIKDQVLRIADSYPNNGIVFHYPEFYLINELGAKTWQEFRGILLNNLQITDLYADTIPDPLKIDILGTEEVSMQIQKELEKSEMSVDISRSSDRSIELTMKDVNKGSGLKYLSTLENIPLEETAVFGNSNNDLPMFAVAGYSVCIGSASEQAAGSANLVAPDCDNDGLSWALQHLFKEEFTG